MNTTAVASTIVDTPNPISNLVGAVARMCRADLDIAVHDLYDEAGGAFYDALAFTSYDTTTPVSIAQQFGGPVLDLACGSGRIGMALARRGHGVVAIDLARPMLGRFAHRLLSEPDEVGARVLLMHADLHEFELSTRFRAAVLGATTIVLVDPGRRRAFFDRVRAHLEPGGVFALDVSPCDLVDLARQPERLSVVEIPARGTAVGYAICSQHFDVRRRREQVSFLVDEVGGPTPVPRVAYTTEKWIITPDEVLADLRAAGFDVRVQAAAGTAGDAYSWLIATAAGEAQDEMHDDGAHRD